MTTIKSYTDLEQSKKLAKFLPLDSADMVWANDNDVIVVPYDMVTRENVLHDFAPCWSLAALLEQLPEIINYEDDESDYALEISKENDLYYLSYGNPFEHGKLEVEPQENFVDACYEMILKLHEQKLL